MAGTRPTPGDVIWGPPQIAWARARIKELETELDALKSKLDNINDDDRGAIDAEAAEEVKP